MLRWAPFPFLRLALAFSGGILVYIFKPVAPQLTLALFLFFLLLYAFSLIYSRHLKSPDWRNMAGICSVICFFLAGIALTHFKTAKSYSHNIFYQNASKITYYTAVVDDYISYKPTSVSTTLAISKVKINGLWQPVSGRVRATFKQDGLVKSLKYGDELVITGGLNLVSGPLNPGQFDYRQYLSNQQVYYQQYLNPNQYIISGNSAGNSIMALSIRLRNYFDKILRLHIKSNREYGIATALVLGIKDYLPDDIKTTYANTGTTHVLAVSGLHVAALFYILNLFLFRWSNNGAYKITSFIIGLAFIWTYGFVTALSGSVLRSVVMFTFILTAKTFRKQTNIYNTLSAAAFLLLLINPYFLVDVGFQLSFLAVFSIVYFEPKIYRFLDFDNRAARWVWKLLSTSGAAQIGVLPLSFYYFHQFPVYFLVANLFAIPLSSLALFSGFGILATCYLPVIPALFGQATEKFLWLMNWLSQWLTTWPLPVLDGINISKTQAWLLYLMLGLVMIFFARKKLLTFGFFTVCTLLFSFMQIAEAKTQANAHYLVIYQSNKNTAIGLIQGQRATLLADSAFYANTKNIQYIITPHWIKLGITEKNLDTLKHIPENISRLAQIVLPDGNILLNWNNQKILICMENVPLPKLEFIKPAYILLHRNPYFNPENMPDIKSKPIFIADGSNQKWYIKKIRTGLQQQGYSVYNTQESGAFLKKLK